MGDKLPTIISLLLQLSEKHTVPQYLETVFRYIISNIDDVSVDEFVKPETLLAWHRRMKNRKWTFAHKNPTGRPRKSKCTEKLMARLAEDSPPAAIFDLTAAAVTPH